MPSTLFLPEVFSGHSAEPTRHTDGDVLLVAYGQDGVLYSVEEPGLMRTWDPTTGQRLGWHDLSDTETVWAFNADARLVASASDDLSIWDTATGNLITALEQPGWVTALAFVPHSDAIVTGHDDGNIACWDSPGRPAFKHGLCFHKRAISALAVSPNCRWLAAASEDRTITIWDLVTGRYVASLAEHSDRIPALAWHPSGKFLISISWDAEACIWDAARFELIDVLEHPTQLTVAALSSDGRRLAFADAGRTIHVWDFAKRIVTHKFEALHADRAKPVIREERRARPRPEEPTFQVEICTLAFNPAGNHLACNGDHTIQTWNLENRRAGDKADPRPLGKTTVSVPADGGRLMSNAGGRKTCIWDTATSRLLTANESDQPVRALAFSPDGQWTATALGTQIHIRDAAGTLFAVWDGPGEPITSLAFSPDSTLLAAGSAHGLPVWIWQVANPDSEPLLKIPDPLDGCSIEALAFHPDNQHLAVAGIDYLATNAHGNDGQVSIWNLTERAEVACFLDGATALAMHPTGNILASTSLDRGIFLWDLPTQQFLNVLTGHDGPVTCLAYSPDGRWLASGSDDHTLRFWDEEGNEERVIEVESRLTALTFSRDQKYLYMGHSNTTCSRLPLQPILKN
jgi:WD40 repeat protein